LRILGIDYGDARTGLALSDETGTLASPLPTYKTQSMRKDADYFAALALEKNAQKIVIGLPINMDGTKGARANKTESLGRVLEKITGLEVIYKDERLTTVSAQRALTESGLSRDKIRANIDAASAQIILQSYLDKIKKEQQHGRQEP